MMDTYRKGIPLSTTTDYWHVDLGRLDAINGPGSYPFPTERAALRFADVHQGLAPNRSVAVRYPIGHREQT